MPLFFLYGINFGELGLKKAIANLNDKRLLNNTKSQINDLPDVYTDIQNEDPLFQSIISYIKNNYMHKIILDNVADELNYSVSSVKNKLKEYDLTFNTTLNRYRIYKSIYFMTLNELPIYKIAKMVGFSDYKYFCTKFKRYTGFSVTELLKKNK